MIRLLGQPRCSMSTYILPLSAFSNFQRSCLSCLPSSHAQTSAKRAACPQPSATNTSSVSNTSPAGLPAYRSGMVGNSDAATRFVLMIDEINRANLAKLQT